jgi:hypothetical protein
MVGGDRNSPHGSIRLNQPATKPYLFQGQSYKSPIQVLEEVLQNQDLRS